MKEKDVIEIAVRGQATGLGLIGAMRRHPDLFIHIEKDSKDGKTPQEWVLIAEKMSEDNGGILQSNGWLQNNGYAGLANAIREHPELFKSVKREFKGGKTRGEWVRIAGEIAKGNNGKLPTNAWLIENGYGKMVSVRYKWPELFNHIGQERKVKTLKEWVATAERLAKKNDGIIPCDGWLRKNGYVGLHSCMYKHPDFFKHLKQDFNGGKKPDEWVKEAEKLASLNEGILPSGTWLRNNGFTGLRNTIYKWPELFQNIKQDHQRKSAEEWVVLAEGLARDNGGMLPNSGWLQRNGYFALYRVFRMNPNLFGHIKCWKRSKGERNEQVK